MDKPIFDATLMEWIRDLSVADPKDLMGKVAKHAEEAGELAGAALSYSGAAGGLHRFVGRKEILDESCDSMLVALSFPLSLGFSYDEIADHLSFKCAHWARKQAKATGASFPLPFEIHVTVAEAEVSMFRSACERIGVKPVLLDLHISGGGVVKDLMTSSTLRTDNAGALAEVRRIADALGESGFRVVREKIETVPWHPAAPSGPEPGQMPEDCYFESHFAIVCTDERRMLLDMLSKAAGLHLSRNVLKRIDGENYTVMATLRSHSGSSEAFEERAQSFAHLIRQSGFPVDKLVVEYAIHDTKTDHDAAWVQRLAA